MYELRTFKLHVLTFPGEYAGFDTEQPTSDTGGKKIVAETLRASSKKLVFIGDGMTDLEAFPPAVSTPTQHL